MIIRLIATSRSIEIEDPKNFPAFSVRIEDVPDAAALAELRGRVAVKHDRGRAWISEGLLREGSLLKSQAWWQDGLTGMITAVQKFGWIDNNSRSIRAHLAHAP